MQFPYTKLVFIFLCIVCTLPANAQKNNIIDRIEPPFWWAGMFNPNLQLLVHGEKISDYNVTIDHDDVKINKIHKVKNPNYLFIDLEILKTAKPGTIVIKLTNKNTTINYDYLLKSKRKPTIKKQAIDPSDVIYLITPDRFANGNPTNDSTEDTSEKVNRKDENGRHGGDLQGIQDHFEYFQELGITTLWFNPILENDQPKYSYHGYGISDFYKTDTRFGSNTDFKTLVDICHQNGMKMIMDQVFNHCGAGHWWMGDLPSENWLNQWKNFTRSNFTNIAASDPHVSKSDYDLLTKGWFDTNLPDLNLKNEFLQTYMIQNSIWWIEYSGIDGIRMDTYPYPNQQAMSKWMQALNNEYPNFFMVAETWAKRASYLSYWNNQVTNKMAINLM